MQLRDRLINIFPNNPTQNRYTRFFKSPSNVLDIGYDGFVRKFEAEMKDKLKTRFDESLEGWYDRYI